MKFPICDIETDSNECRCGFQFNEKTFNEEKVARYFAVLKKSKNLREKVTFFGRFHKFQRKKYIGKGGWSYENTANLFEMHKSQVSDLLKLFKHPEELDKADSIAGAKHRVKNRSKRYPGFQTEEKLHQFLVKNWSQTPYNSDWELKDSHCNAEDCGEIDLLAKHRSKPIWLIIELKKGDAPDKTVGQLLRYMGWFKRKRLSENENVQGLIISGYPPDIRISYAIEYTNNITQKIYYRKDGKIEIMDSDTAHINHFFNNNPELREAALAAGKPK